MKTKAILDNIYKTTIANLAKVKLLASYNDYLYRNFPENIPDSVKSELQQKAGESFGDMIVTLFSKKEVKDLSGFGYLHAYANFEVDDSTDKRDFLQIILQQEWITYFAYVEAFFQDICRFIYSFDNHLLAHHKKQIQWEDIIQAGDYDSLLNLMIESTVEKSGYKNLADTIELWNRPPYLFNILIDKDDLLMLRWSIATRNLIIHNNSRMTKECYDLTTQVAILRKAKSSVEPIGSKLDLDTTSLTGLYILLHNIVEGVYNAITAKYFSQ